MEEQNKLIVFQEKEIRRVWHNEEWWFSVVDVIEVLTESDKPRDYWYRLKRREKKNNERIKNPRLALFSLFGL